MYPWSKNAKRRERAQIILSDNSVLKLQDKRETKLEIARTQIGWEIGRKSSAFSVPSVLAHEWELGSMTFERIFCMKPLRNVLSVSSFPEEFIKKAATALVTIHNFPVNFEKNHAFVFEEPFPSKMPKVFIHGDFSATNIFIREKDDDLVIIDWAPPTWLDINICEGRIYQDLSIFILSLFMRRPLEQDKINNPSLLAEIFLDYYRSHTKGEFSLVLLKTEFSSLLDRFLHSQRNFKQTVKIYARYRTIQKSRQFVDNLQLK